MVQNQHRRFRLHRFARGVFGHVVALGLLATMFVAMIGIPVPEQKEPTGGQPFPCQDHPCGCKSAAHCWDDCCCYSDQEKLDWAYANHVQPPEFLVARVKSADSPALASVGAGRSCCASDRKCCSAKPKCCSTTISNNEPTSAVETATGMDVVLVDAAAKCRGLHHVWTLLSSVVLGRIGPRYPRPEPFLIHWMRVTSDHALSAIDGVDPPVPWTHV